MRITSKGQVTIPIDIREKAGLLPQTDVTFEWDGEVVRLLPAASSTKPDRGAEVVRRLRGSADVKMSTDEILALTRGE
jgi:bifunctional DNA-binding transcriptional regulator/antitoxin component of YhaV-PrlF toxin-antitoxin module